MGKVVHFWDKCALAAREPTIHRMKGDVHGFYMTHKNLIWSKRLQSYLSHKLLLPVGLVQYYFFFIKICSYQGLWASQSSQIPH